MAVPHQAVAPVRQPHVLHQGQERLGFRLHRLRQQPAVAAPQSRRQRILDRVRLTQETTVLSLLMAYRSFGRFRQASTRLDTPPFSHRHHPVSAIALCLARKHDSDVHAVPSSPGDLAGGRAKP